MLQKTRDRIALRPVVEECIVMEYDFKALGKRVNAPSKELETFPRPEHVTVVRFTSDELTSFCPVTEQPDFNTVEIEYHPRRRCVESKSLKLYLWSFREERIFGEGLASTIAADLDAALEPHYCRVTLIQNIRGGMQLTAVAEIGEPQETKA
ncbi:MAG: preQ(1) synthase [Chloroflexota bacterium]